MYQHKLLVFFFFFSFPEVYTQLGKKFSPEKNCTRFFSTASRSRLNLVKEKNCIQWGLINSDILTVDSIWLFMIVGFNYTQQPSKYLLMISFFFHILIDKVSIMNVTLMNDSIGTIWTWIQRRVTFDLLKKITVLRQTSLIVIYLKWCIYKALENQKYHFITFSFN